MPDRQAYRYLIVDVFTQVPLEGNALAVFPEPTGLPDEKLQQIAREFNLSETVFLERPSAPGCAARVRIFNPVREMDFAGHPTIGAAWVLRQEGLVPPDTASFSLEEKIGVVPVRIELTPEPMIWLTTPTIHFHEQFEPEICARLLGLNPEDLLDVPPQLIDAGNPGLFIPLRGKAEVDRAVLDSSVFAQLRPRFHRPSCIFVFAPTPEGAYSRMLAPDYGIAEDPASGSCTGPLAAFMARNRLLQDPSRRRFVSEQGTKMGRRSLLHFELGRIEGIPVGGQVIPVGDGRLYL